MAAAVSSQLVSMPKTTTSPSRFEVGLWGSVATQEILREEYLWWSWNLRKEVKSEGFGRKFKREIEIDGATIVDRKSSIVVEKKEKKGGMEDFDKKTEARVKGWNVKRMC